MVSVFKDRRQVFAWVHLVSVISLLFFISTHLIEGCCYPLAMIETGLVVIMLVALWRIRQGASMQSIENILMASAVVLFSALVFFESIADTGAFWISGFPFVAYFVHQVKKARFWVALLFTEIIVAACLQSAHQVVTPYSVTQLFCLAAIVLFFWVFAHIYQSQLELSKQMLQKSYDTLAQHKQQMQVILDHSPIGIWMLDAEFHIQFLNRAWVIWSGISELQAQQASDYRDMMPDSLAARIQGTDQACFEGGADYCREEIPCADGKKRIFDMVKVKLTGANGEASGLVGFAIDVSEKVRAEKEQKSLEQQVQHSQRLESLGVMAGGIAHDFNNLLTVIQGNIELLKVDCPHDENILSSLDCMATASQAAIELCTQMLVYSGKGAMQKKAFYLRELIEEMLPLLHVSVGKQARLQCDLGQCAAAIQADRSQIRQVLLNLVINASEAMAPDQHGDIDVRLSDQQLDIASEHHFIGGNIQAGMFHVLSIRDHGVGMDADTIEHMFDPFFTTKFTGRGLGLSAILGILRAHDAGLEVDSRPGEGSCISVWFPAAEDAVVQPHSDDLVVSCKQSGRVLVVDDESGVLQVAARMLEKTGVNVVTASSGREAVALFGQGGKFDWVMLDVTMPEMDGVECMMHLRNIQPDIYIMMTSGYNADCAIIPSQESPPDDFLTKPFTFASLRAAAAKAATRMIHE